MWYGKLLVRKTLLLLNSRKCRPSVMSWSVRHSRFLYRSNPIASLVTTNTPKVLLNLVLDLRPQTTPTATVRGSRI